jgi:fructokinase
MTMSQEKPKCLLTCEVLWDCFADRELLGGATLNVAYHLHQLDTQSVLLSSVGKDRLGDMALEQIREQWGCDTSFIRTLDDTPTGSVIVTLDSKGDATYEVGTPAAWDYIDIPAEATSMKPEAFVYGSVALRSDYNKKSFSRFLDSYEGLSCFDANLRLPHNSVEMVLEYAERAGFLKMNEQELDILAEAAGCKCGDLESTMTSLASKLGVDTLCVTCAADPAVMLWHGAISYGSTFKVDIEDTVGAGDAFFASMIDSLLHPDFDPCPALTRATALGSWVASRPGAQPEYDNSVPDAARE